MHQAMSGELSHLNHTTALIGRGYYSLLTGGEQAGSCGLTGPTTVSLLPLRPSRHLSCPPYFWFIPLCHGISSAPIRLPQGHLGGLLRNQIHTFNKPPTRPLVQLFQGPLLEKPCVTGALGPHVAPTDGLLILGPLRPKDSLSVTVWQAL